MTNLPPAADRVTVEWGNVTPDGDYIPRQTEKDARQTATNRGWPVIRRTITITAWALADA
jgi:hypothetical protein